jgi:diguanylate cyclase (GGDEF)-like protein
MNEILDHDIQKNILVIDDDDVMQEKLRRILRTTPYKLQEAASGKEATALLEANEYDCVLLDNRLGDANGVELMPIIQNLLQKPCPIIMITGSGDERLIVEAMRSGVYDYINKNEVDVQHLSSAISSGLRWAELEKELLASRKKIEHLSMYDELTGMPNRYLFFDRLEQARLHAIRENSGFAVLMMDLNLFKEVNDTFGHAAGDSILKQVGERLINCTRDVDTFARLGGDEFSCIIDDAESSEKALSVVKKILAAIKKPFVIDDHFISIGIAIAFFPSNGQLSNANALLANADNAMYKAKKNAHGYEFYEETTQTTIQSSLMTIAGHIANALENNEFTLAYQPQISLIDGRCCGIEALARWHSPTLGTITPDEFIQVAERSSIILDLSYAIFDMAIKQASEWQSQGIKLPMSVNMSAKMLDDEALLENIESILAKYQYPADLLTVEITETSLLSNPDNAATIIDKLSAKDIQISIDDFGTGYTSFKYLREFKFDELKIDQLYITLLEKDTLDASIVKSFVSLGSGFNINLIAEGVEDLERLLLLKQMQCGRAQGYFISKPMPGNLMPAWIKDWEANPPSIFDEVNTEVALKTAAA